MRLVVFDFDWSLINENSDTYVIEQLTPDLVHELERRQTKDNWTSLMDYMIGRMMNDKGITREKFSLCLRGIPYFEETLNALRLAKEKGSEVYIISDANTFYISEILNEHKLDHLVSDIVTNPAIFQEDGILRIMPYHENGHNCKLCPQNLCKGLVLQNIIEKFGGRSQIEQIIYIGDGGGDFCPTHNLLGNDIICCRNDWSLHRKLIKCNTALQAQLKPWNNGHDILNIFTEIYN